MALSESANADVVIMDIGMPARSSTAVHAPPSSAHSDKSYVVRALKAGAHAYLLEDSAEADLLAEARTKKEVANMLSLSRYTVEIHRTHMLQAEPARRAGVDLVRRAQGNHCLTLPG